MGCQGGHKRHGRKRLSVIGLCRQGMNARAMPSVIGLRTGHRSPPPIPAKQQIHHSHMVNQLRRQLGNIRRLPRHIC